MQLITICNGCATPFVTICVTICLSPAGCAGTGMQGPGGSAPPHSDWHTHPEQRAGALVTV